METPPPIPSTSAGLPGSGDTLLAAFVRRQHAGHVEASDVRTRVDALIDATWAFSALSALAELDLLAHLEAARTPAELASTTGLSAVLTKALLDVLVSVGFVRCEDLRYTLVPEVMAFVKATPREDLLARLRSAHLQSTAMVDGARHRTLQPGWIHTDPELLQAQGRTGRATTHAMAQLFPLLPGLQERLVSRDGMFLDVGMGVGIMSVELCRLYPELRVVGLEPGAVQADEARRNIVAAGFENRITVRQQRLEDLTDRQAYDFAYLAQVFMPIEVVKPGLASIREALRPGGWISMAAFDAPGNELHATSARLINVLWGGTPIDLEELSRLTREAGFDMVRAVGESGASVKGIVGRRP